MTNLIYIDRANMATSKNFICGVIAIVIFSIANFVPFFVWVALLFVMKIIISSLRLAIIKRKILAKAFQVNGYYKPMKIGPEIFGVFEVQSGVLVFTGVSGERYEVFDSNPVDGEFPVLRVELLDALTQEQFKKVIVHRGSKAWVLPVEVWNVHYPNLRTFKIKSSSVGSLGASKKFGVLALFFSFGILPLLTKITLNIIFGQSPLSDIGTFDFVLPIIGGVTTCIFYFFGKKNQKTPSVIKEDVLKNDPLFVKGFEC